jgi:predicted regulator of Ras-like GTPase activity (Roadblock/LC7/MglB family)
MLDLITEASALGALLEETRGVVGVVLATDDGEPRATVGHVNDGDTCAMVAAALTRELNKIGSVLGLGTLGVASLKAGTAARVFAEQSGAVVVIELDPKRPLGELETKLRTVAWAPEEDLLEIPKSSRMPTVPAPPPRMPPRSTAPTPPPPITAQMPATLPPQLHTIPTTIPSLSGAIPPAMPPPLPLSAGNAAARSSPATGFPTRPGRSTAPPVIVPAVKSVGSGPVFTGDLEEFCLPDLLEFLRNSHRTGLLVCTTERGVGRVQLSRGMIIGADSPHALDLREHFLTSTQLAPERRRLLAALPLECFGDDMIETVLVSRDLVPRDEVERARIARIYSAFREMMGWTSGRFSFDPAVPIVTNPALALSAQSILMQIYQEQDEQGQ